MRVRYVFRWNARLRSCRLSAGLAIRKYAHSVLGSQSRHLAAGGAGPRQIVNAGALLVPFLAGMLALGVSGCGVAIPGANSNSTGTLVVSTQAINFGSVIVGHTASATVSLINTGSAPVQIEQIDLQGAAFAVNGQSSAPISVAAGTSYSLGVSFHPTSTGAATGALILTSSVSSTSQVIVSLSGTGEAIAANPALGGLTCASGALTGAGTDSCTVRLTSAADSSGLDISLASNTTAVSVPASVKVPAGKGSATFTAMVSAVAKAERAAVTATAGGVTKSYSIQLGAEGPGLTLQSTSVPFGDVILNSAATQTVLLTSSGTAALTVSAIAITGKGFSLTNGSSPVTLQPGETATLEIQFDPTVAGLSTGTVTLTANTSGDTATIALSGTGEVQGEEASYEVELNWVAPADSADPVAGYNIYRAVSGSSSYQLVNASVDNVTSYTDTEVQNGKSYTYYVVSVDATGNQSAPSNVFSAVIP